MTPVTTTADEALAPEKNKGSRADKHKEVEEWLKSLLSDGAKPSDEIMEQAKSAGHSRRAVWQAKDVLKITAYKEGFGTGAAWKWSLPTEEYQNF